MQQIDPSDSVQSDVRPVVGARPGVKAVIVAIVLLCVLASAGVVVFLSLRSSANSTTELKPEQSIDFGGGVKVEFMLIPAGTFEMGEKGDARTVPHRVTISKPFYMAKFEATQEQWEAVVGYNLSEFQGAKNPVENVSWVDVQAFLKKARETTGKNLRLPTEAEWEYACRAGTTTAFYNGDDVEALRLAGWDMGSLDNRNRSTNRVGRKMPNAYGLFDMHGNVYEWCQDWYDDYYYKSSPEVDPQGPESGSKRVLRGGAWAYNAASCSSSSRHELAPDRRGSSFGFRVVLIPDSAPNGK